MTDALPDRRASGARQDVAALYEAHAIGLIRLAKVMLGDQGAAEDVVQDAFLGLYRRWDSLSDHQRPVGYLPTSVLNGCRSAFRGQTRRDRALRFAPRADDI